MNFNDQSRLYRRRTIYWRTADVSANGPSMRSPGRYIGGVHEVVIRALLRFAEAPTVGWSNVLICIIGLLRLAGVFRHVINLAN